MDDLRAKCENFEESGRIPIQELRVILLWPLRIRAGGSLGKLRANANTRSSEWLAQYRDWIITKGEGKWERVIDYYGEGGRGGSSDTQRYAEYLYFHPFIQQCFYSQAPDTSPVAMLKRTDIKSAEIELRKDEKWRCDVSRVNLFLFPTDVAIAAIQLNVCISSAEDARKFTLADGLDFVDWVRRVYPPFYYDDGRPGKVAYKIAWASSKVESDFQEREKYFETTAKNRTTPVGSHWNHLLQPLTPDDRSENEGIVYSQVEDDRMAVMAYVSVPDPKRISSGDWVRLAYCDDRGDSDKHPYSRIFLGNFQKEDCYDRFWDPEAGFTTRYLLTGYSMLAVGRRGEWEFDNLVRGHMERHYFLLMLLAHMQKASLLAFWKRLADIMHEFESKPASKDKGGRDALAQQQNWLLQDFTDFVSRFYFPEVSNQLQALELFGLMSKKLRIAETFGEVKEQAEFVRKVVYEQRQEETAQRQEQSARAQETLARAEKRLSSLAFKLAPLGLAASILGINTLPNSFDPERVGETIGKVVISIFWLALLTGSIWGCIRNTASGTARKPGREDAELE